MNRGHYRRNANQLGEAIADFTEVIRLNPNDDTAYNSRANAYNMLHRNSTSLDDYRRGVADYSEAIRLKPKSDMYLVNRAHHLLQRKTPQSGGVRIIYADPDYSGAMADLTDAIRLNPKNEGAYRYRYSVYANTDPEKAEADLKESLRLEATAATQ